MENFKFYVLNDLLTYNIKCSEEIDLAEKERLLKRVERGTISVKEIIKYGQEPSRPLKVENIPRKLLGKYKNDYEDREDEFYKQSDYNNYDEDEDEDDKDDDRRREEEQERADAEWDAVMSAIDDYYDQRDQERSISEEIDRLIDRDNRR